MLFTDSSEKRCFTFSDSPRSNRYITLKYFTYCDKEIYVKYQLVLNSERRCLCNGSLQVTYRKCFIPDVILTKDTNRYCISGWGEANSAERKCFYIPNYNWILTTPTVYLTLIYYSEKSSICCTDPISIRTVILHYTIYSDRYSVVQRINKTLIDSPQVSLAIRFFSDKQLFCEAQLKYTQRFTLLTYTTSSEKEVLAMRFNQTTLYTPTVQTTIFDYLTERKCVTKSEYTLTERICLIMTAYFTERNIGFRMGVHSERYCCSIIPKSTHLHSFIITPSRLEYSEKWGFCIGTKYLTERQVFYEMRKLFVTKTPTSSTDSHFITSDKDDSQTTIYLTNERSISLHGNVERTELQSKIDRNIYVIGIKDKEVTIAGTDDKGAKIVFKDNEQKEKKLIYTAPATIDINFI